jgi:small subunit ribosomal protein S10e
MLISKANRRAIYENLFKGERAFSARPLLDLSLTHSSLMLSEGVMVAAKDFNLASHPDLPEIPNLEVIKSMQSLNSRGYVKTQFSWLYYYYTLTPEGLDYLREFLHLPSEIVPNTLKRPTRAAPAQARAGGAYRAPRTEGEGRGEYRSAKYAGVGRGAPRE